MQFTLTCKLANNFTLERIIIIIIIIIVCGTAAQRGLMATAFTRFLDHKQRRATVGRTSLDE
jgi:hypothetical protein